MQQIRTAVLAALLVLTAASGAGAAPFETAQSSVTIKLELTVSFPNGDGATRFEAARFTTKDAQVSIQQDLATTDKIKLVTRREVDPDEVEPDPVIVPQIVVLADGDPLDPAADGFTPGDLVLPAGVAVQARKVVHGPGDVVSSLKLVTPASYDFAFGDPEEFGADASLITTSTSSAKRAKKDNVPVGLLFSERSEDVTGRLHFGIGSVELEGIATGTIKAGAESLLP